MRAGTSIINIINPAISSVTSSGHYKNKTTLIHSLIKSILFNNAYTKWAMHRILFKIITFLPSHKRSNDSIIGK